MAARLAKVVAATSDTNGNLQASFDSPPIGRVWTGAVSVPNAPTAAIFQAFLGSTAAAPLGTFIGKQSLTGVQAWAGESVIVAGSGLTPSTSYSVTFYGADEAEELAQPAMPLTAANPGGGTATLNILNFITDVATFTVNSLVALVLAASDPVQLAAGFIADAGVGLSVQKAEIDGPADPVSLVFIADSGVTFAHN